MDLPNRVFRPLFIAVPLVMAMLVAVVTVSLALAVTHDAASHEDSVAHAVAVRDASASK